mgnify:CR=1 FL=1
MAELYKVDESFDHSLFKNASCALVCLMVFILVINIFLIALKKQLNITGENLSPLPSISILMKFHPERLRKLMSNERRLETLLASGVDAVVALPSLGVCKSISC